MKKVRLADIAKRAGVSPATVSNALNGREGVSREISQRVRQLAEEMGYAPDARREGRKPYIRLVIFKCHGLVVMDTQFFAELIQGIERGCREEQVELLVTNVHRGEDPDYRARVQSICKEASAGVLLLGTEMSPEDLALFRDCRSPLLVVDNLFQDQPVHSIVMNNFDAGRLATQALIRAGHTRIGHITSRISFGNTDDRERGYRAAMEAQGLCCPPQGLLRVTPTLEGAYGDMRSILEENRPLPTAFFAANDIMAMGCLRALAERGIRVPEDVSLIGMDDLSLCQVSSPPLTTVHVYRAEMGRAAVQMLLHTVATAGFCWLKSQISVSLVERDSVKRRLPDGRGAEP